MVPVKGVDVLLRAATSLPSVRVEIAGDGPERLRLEREARALGVDARFHGWVEPDALATLLDRASCVVIPSRVLGTGRTEGRPHVLLQALAAGAPVVASAVGDLALTEDDAWLAVPPEDPQALAGAVRRTLDAPQETRARVGRGRALAATNEWPGVADAHAKLFAGIAR
jgi:glycosyltransferase involved in cell wall biosynthesis